MAKKFFNKRVNSRKKNIITFIIIGICIIGIIFCVYITQNMHSEDSSSTSIVVTLQDSVTVDLNSEEPDKNIFFSELSGISENDISVDYSNVDFSKIGEYTVTVTVQNDKTYVKLVVSDVSKPVLTLTAITITDGDKYSASDFVKTCTDNSNEECKISFFGESVDQNGDLIDYSKYTEVGSYDIEIVATDVNGNSTYQSTKLYITSTPSACTYGNDNYSSDIIMTYDVTNNGCALSIDLYHSSSVVSPIESIADTEVTKLKSEIDLLSNLGTNIIFNRSINAILNDSGIGFVGYSLYLEVTKSDGDIIVGYYLADDGDRVYVYNPYNLK